MGNETARGATGNQGLHTPSICVVGSANLDIVVPVEHHPVAGETVLGGDHLEGPGGKGANQAVAASRLGYDVGFVGRIGEDTAAAKLRHSLLEAGVDCSYLLATANVPSGIALISVARNGDNAIVVSPGANARLTPTDVTDAASAVSGASVVLLQLEIATSCVAAAVKVATGTVVLNPAPAARLEVELLDNVDVLVPNQTELGLLSGLAAPQSVDEAKAAAQRLPSSTVVVTLGANGALIVEGTKTHHVAAPKVTPVDTTAAGDAFCGALAGAISGGASLGEAVAFAVRVGTVTTLRAGAQPSLPTRDEVDALLAAYEEKS